MDVYTSSSGIGIGLEPTWGSVTGDKSSVRMDQPSPKVLCHQEMRHVDGVATGSDEEVPSMAIGKRMANFNIEVTWSILVFFCSSHAIAIN